MYASLLPFHSLIRWLVLICLVCIICRSYYGWFRNIAYSGFDKKIRVITVSVVHIQAVIGLWLYIVSPMVSYFLRNFGEAIKLREIRFFGMEHITMMIIAIVLISTGSSKAKKKTTDKEKFKTIAVWFSIALFIIFMSIPWELSPFTSRPYYRSF